MQNPTIYNIIGMCLKHRKQIYDLHYIHIQRQQQDNYCTSFKKKKQKIHITQEKITNYVLSLQTSSNILSKKINQRIH
jgi:hypothetical protein